MAPISSHGNKLAVSMSALVVLALITTVGTYRLKKSAEIKRWQKELSSYNVRLENENQMATGTIQTEE